MMVIPRSTRRGLRRRKLLKVLPVVAGLCALALVAPATSGAKDSLKLSTNVGPSCDGLSVSGSWTPVSGQAYVGVSVLENQTGTVVDSSPVSVSPTDDTYSQTLSEVVLSPLQSGKHVFKVTISVLDAGMNPLVSARANLNAPCELGTIILPT